MAQFANAVCFLPTAGGTGNFTVSSAVTGYMTPSLAGMVTGTYKYRAESSNLGEWEIGEGVYTSGTGILTRATVLYNSSGTGTATGQSGAGSKINFTAPPNVGVVQLVEDTLGIDQANSWSSAQKLQVKTNINALGAVKIQKFTASGTYTPDANLIYAQIECWGAGGGGGGVAGLASQTKVGGGGGGGGYSKTLSSAATIGASQTVTIGAAGSAGAAGNNAGGAGGDTSVGSLCIGKGGSGGGGGAYSQSSVGGVAGTGDVTAPGMPGSHAFGDLGASMTIGVGGRGGHSTVGGGGAGGLANGVATAGSAGSGFASGGGGAAAHSTTATAAGGAGAPGYVVITEFCKQ